MIYTEADDSLQVSTVCVFRYCNKITSPGSVFFNLSTSRESAETEQRGSPWLVSITHY